MNIEIFEDIIFKLKNCIKNTEFENNLYIHGGYLRDLYYNLIPYDLDLILISNKNNDDNIFLELICNTFNLNKNDICYTNFNGYIFYIYKTRVDLKIFNNIDKINNEDFLNNKIKETADYTINSLVQNVTTNNILYFCNTTYKDLKNKLITPVNSLDFIYYRSPYRIIRLIRLYYKYNVKIPLSIIRYIRKNSYLINFIDNKILANEHNKILSHPNVCKILKLLNVLNINPTDKNRFPIFFGSGWHELEPSNSTIRVVDGKKYRWSKNNAEIFIGPDVELLKLIFIKHPSSKNNSMKIYYDNDTFNLSEISCKIGYNDIVLNVKNYKKINILVDTFVPSKVENINDNRELGICLTDCKVYKFFKNMDVLIEQIPYLLN